MARSSKTSRLQIRLHLSSSPVRWQRRTRAVRCDLNRTLPLHGANGHPGEAERFGLSLGTCASWIKVTNPE
jgi:hypothetical protein